MSLGRYRGTYALPAQPQPAERGPPPSSEHQHRYRRTVASGTVAAITIDATSTFELIAPSEQAPLSARYRSQRGRGKLHPGSELRWRPDTNSLIAARTARYAPAASPRGMHERTSPA